MKRNTLELIKHRAVHSRCVGVPVSKKRPSIVALKHDTGVLPEVNIHLFKGHLLVLCHRLGDKFDDRFSQLAPRAEDFHHHRHELQTLSAASLLRFRFLDFGLVVCGSGSGIHTSTFDIFDLLGVRYGEVEADITRA